MPLTVQALATAGCRRETAKDHLPHIVKAMAAEDITTPARARHFLAQALHECMRLQAMQEIWGPTALQLRYEGSTGLGNARAGDGHRYLGRGPFMLTGRGNYTAYGRKLGRPYADHPELVGKPADGWLVAARYWADHGLNALADRGDGRGITRAINGAATDDAPSHHLRRMEILRALPEDCAPDPFVGLTREERAVAAALDAERKSAKRHGGWANIDPSHLRHASELKAQLHQLADAVRNAAEVEPHGWEIKRRRERFRLLTDIAS